MRYINKLPKITDNLWTKKINDNKILIIILFYLHYSLKEMNAMANIGDSYTIPLKPSHLNWGEYRNSTNRDFISGEGYIPIPKSCAENYGIYNSNYASGLGINLFYASSADGFLNNELLLAQGCSQAGDIYAKQFSVQGNLQMIGDWYKKCNATPDNSVSVTWTSPTSIFLEIL